MTPQGTTEAPRFDVYVSDADRRAELERSVFDGLAARPRQLQAKWLYDERGGELFGQITELEEYYLTRCEGQILERIARQLPKLAPAHTIIELGAGDSAKTRHLAAGCVAAGSPKRFVTFDIDGDSLERATGDIHQAFPHIEVRGVLGDMMQHLEHLPRGRDQMVALLGSTIGNFLPEQRLEFYDRVRNLFDGGRGWLLLGFDLVKDPALLHAAYNDVAGVTAAFTTNVLAMLNRELGANFDTSNFSHVAEWDPRNEWMRVGLRARQACTVTVRDLDEASFAFDQGEQLFLEVCTKFRYARVERELASCQYAIDGWWTDDRGWFAVCLARAMHG